MAAKKKVAKKRKPSPKMLGTGLAGKAAKGMVTAEKRRQCIMNGGTWKNGKCVY